MVWFVFNIHVGIELNKNYLLAQAVKTLLPKCLTTVGICASNFSTSHIPHIPNNLVETERFDLASFKNSDFR